MITCFIRSRIDSRDKHAFARHARNRGQAIPRRGAELIGCFGPHEGSATTACGAYSVASLAAYEASCTRLRGAPLGRENYESAQREGFILKEDRLFLNRVSDPHAPP